MRPFWRKDKSKDESKADSKEAGQRFYFDDPEVGSSPKTSHPLFVQLAPDAFFYQDADDFAPFGSDDGSDALRMLEDWFRDGGRPSGVIHFLRNTIAGWGLGVPQNLGTKTEKGMNTWLEKADINANFLASECRLRIAVALGQLKICGEIDYPILNEAQYGIRWLSFLNARSTRLHPDWQYAGLEAEGIARMKDVLDRYRKHHA